ncbi:MAG: hypothetical protein ACYS80_22445 [Planctomycetota bacterium]|jgi:hypothetical protein
MTSTHGRGADEVQNSLEKLTPQMTPTAYSKYYSPTVFYYLGIDFEGKFRGNVANGSITPTTA